MRWTLPGIRLAAAPAAAFWAGAAVADIFGVVVGVDDYRHLPRLEGAVADAEDIAGALAALGAEVTLLRDAEATRARVLDAFADAARRARPGDMIVLSFAGHGVQEPEAHPGEEADGLDETLVFAGFAPQGAASAERLRDNEIAGLFAQAAEGVRILFVVDACHSGTMTRALDPRGRQAQVRTARIDAIEDDALPPPPAAGPREPAELPGVVLIAAALDHEQVPETPIDGRMRGALSWTVARALSGEAGVDPTLWPLERFEDHVRARVRALAAGRQTPSLTYDRGPDGPRMLVPPSAPPPSARLRPSPPSAPPPVPAVHAPGMDAGLAGMADALRPAGSAAEADLLWDVAAAEVIDMATADVVALAETPAAVRGAAEAWRAGAALDLLAARRPLAIALEPGGARLRIGDRLTLSVPRPEDRAERLLIVALGGDGRARTLFPPAGAPPGSDLIAPGPEPLRLGPIPVTPPAGADRLAVARCDCDLGPLAALTRTPGRDDAPGFVAALEALAEGAPALIGAATVYTAR